MALYNSVKWVVTFFSSGLKAPYTPGTWVGDRKDGGDLVLFETKQHPSNSRLTFSNITKNGCNWIGDWISNDEIPTLSGKLVV